MDMVGTVAMITIVAPIVVAASIPMVIAASPFFIAEYGGKFIKDHPLDLQFWNHTIKLEEGT